MRYPALSRAVCAAVVITSACNDYDPTGPQPFLKPGSPPLFAVAGTESSYAYACGVSMAPDQAVANTEVENSWSTWKSSYVTSQGAGGYLRVVTHSDSSTVSEGIAYGMLLAAYLDDRSTFDGLWGYAKSHFNLNGLMAWQVMKDGSVPDPSSSTDSDEDMAFALIVAQKKWGGYGTDTQALLDNVLRYDVEATTFVLKPGNDWGGSSVTNPSYFAPGYYSVFRDYTGNNAWTNVRDKAYEIIANVNAKTGAGTTGLQPDWTTATGDSVTTLDSMRYSYLYNATRVPWRLAMHHVWFCSSRAKSQLDKLNTFFKGVGAGNIKDGYALDGTLIGEWHMAAFVGPAMAGAIASSDGLYKEQMWYEAESLRNEGYYHDSLRLLALLLASGNMPHPLYRILDSYESGSASKWNTFSDASSTITVSVVSPGAIGSGYAMKVDYTVSSSGWAGAQQSFSPTPQDWSKHRSIDFQFYGTNTGNTSRLELYDNSSDGTGTNAERFEHTFTDNFTGWRSFSVPWSGFTRRSWQPTGAPNDGLTLAQMWGFNFAPVNSGTGSFRVDQVNLSR